MHGELIEQIDNELDESSSSSTPYSRTLQLLLRTCRSQLLSQPAHADTEPVARPSYVVEWLQAKPDQWLIADPTRYNYDPYDLASCLRVIRDESRFTLALARRIRSWYDTNDILIQLPGPATEDAPPQGEPDHAEQQSDIPTIPDPPERVEGDGGFQEWYWRSEIGQWECNCHEGILSEYKQLNVLQYLERNSSHAGFAYYDGQGQLFARLLLTVPAIPDPPMNVKANGHWQNWWYRRNTNEWIVNCGNTSQGPHIGNLVSTDNLAYYDPNGHLRYRLIPVQGTP